jgi:hypothetical protein
VAKVSSPESARTRTSNGARGVSAFMATLFCSWLHHQPRCRARPVERLRDQTENRRGHHESFAGHDRLIKRHHHQIKPIVNTPATRHAPVIVPELSTTMFITPSVEALEL